MVKYASNAFHALKVCFANEIGDVCAALGADAQEVMRVFRMDRKLNVSETYLRRGSRSRLLPAEGSARVAPHRPEADVPSPLLAAILPSNETQIRRGVEAVLATRRLRVASSVWPSRPGPTICGKARWSPSSRR